MSLLKAIPVQFLLSEEHSSPCELTASSNRQFLSSRHRVAFVRYVQAHPCVVVCGKWSFEFMCWKVTDV